MKRFELIVIGAGPAGLSAAVEAAKAGMCVGVFDENARPGGQLFKQIHKFFGSKEHMAKIRGFRIGELLLKEAEEAGVNVYLNATVMGIFPEKTISVKFEDHIEHFRGDHIVVATGAAENMVLFDGWTKPGLIGAGAAQTLMNLYGVQPGKRVLMVGSGNVGLVVGYQLLQAGCELAAVIDAAPRVGGYGVHAAKLARQGVPFYMSHTILKAEGEACVSGAMIAEVDSSFRPVPGTEKHIDADTICLAVGLSPMSQVLRMSACEILDTPGGLVPKVNEYGETTVPGIYAAGDVAGIEEASSAMLSGRITGAAAAYRGGYLSEEEFTARVTGLKASLQQLRQGMFSKENRGRADLAWTDEGYRLSESLLKYGFVDEAELERFPAAVYKTSGVHPVIECTQNIPCNPCQDACRTGCIVVGGTITNIPALDEGKTCTGCGLCVASCSGQAIFLVDDHYDNNRAAVTMPYEFLPYPKKGQYGTALDRAGQPLCRAEVVALRTNNATDQTALLTIAVPKEYTNKARAFKLEGGSL
jgi:NADPH-dependent 2,4-dienoyl-CoA reductase/sulfur reductase-like enzyme/Fe-S-cluster-containing hydrogenase component 2